MTAPDRIVVVHADDDVLDTVRQALDGEGYEIHFAPDGLEGLSCVDRVHPSLVISDTMLPKLDGITLLHAIHATADGPPPPVLFLSGRVDTEAMLSGLAAGARFYITLPVQPGDLRAKVRRLLGL